MYKMYIVTSKKETIVRSFENISICHISFTHTCTTWFTLLRRKNINGES